MDEPIPIKPRNQFFKKHFYYLRHTNMEVKVIYKQEEGKIYTLSPHFLYIARNFLLTKKCFAFLVVYKE